MAKQFIKRTLMAIVFTMLIVIVASLTYQYVVPMILSMDTSNVSDGINTGKGMLYNAKEQVMNVMGQNEENSQETQTDTASQDVELWYENKAVEKSQGTQTSTASQDAIPYGTLVCGDRLCSEPASTASQDAIPYGTALGGKVTKIVDGDTLDIDGTRIRLALVNTPERAETGYAEATKFTRLHCPVGSTAMYDMDDGQRDGSYGRVIAKVWCFGYPVVTPSTSLNAMLVNSGHAEIFHIFCNTSEFSSDEWANC